MARLGLPETFGNFTSQRSPRVRRTCHLMFPDGTCHIALQRPTLTTSR